MTRIAGARPGAQVAGVGGVAGSARSSRGHARLDRVAVRIMSYSDPAPGRAGPASGRPRRARRTPPTAAARRRRTARGAAARPARRWPAPAPARPRLELVGQRQLEHPPGRLDALRPHLLGEPGQPLQGVHDPRRRRRRCPIPAGGTPARAAPATRPPGGRSCATGRLLARWCARWAARVCGAARPTRSARPAVGGLPVARCASCAVGRHRCSFYTTGSGELHGILAR